MPSLAALHPQVVHFVVALILVGVALRWASLAWRMSWLTPAATTLVALGTLASVVAVRSGTVLDIVKSLTAGGLVSNLSNARARWP